MYKEEVAASLRALDAVCDIDGFDEWLESVDGSSASDHITGHRLLTRAIFGMFQDYLMRDLDRFAISEDYEFRCAFSELADIDTLEATCNASHLIKHFDDIDQDIHSAEDVESLSRALKNLDEDVISSFINLFDNNVGSGFGSDALLDEAANFHVITFANDGVRGYPEAFQMSWLPLRFSKNAPDDNVESYKLALIWLYQCLARDDKSLEPLEEEFESVTNWQELDNTFQTAREVLLDHNHGDLRNEVGSEYGFYLDDTPEEVEHLLRNAPDPAVGKQRALDRVFLWDFANNGEDVLYGSGAAGFLTLLFGLRGIRSALDSEAPIRVRRIKHPDDPGYNYSYAILQSGWSLKGAGSLHGWSVFIRVATDYSGFGGRQHDIIEEYLSSLTEKDIVKVKEFEVAEEVLEDYIEDSGHIQTPSPNRSGERFYDGRRFSLVLREGENERTEFKEEFPSNAQNIAKVASALANHKGGLIVFGVTDNEDLIGVDDPDSVCKRTSGILRNSLQPPLKAEIIRENIDGSQVVIVEIPSSEKPVGANYTYYFRNGTRNAKLTYQGLKERFE